ncbi:MAG: TIGR01458 family HAD-type hydrolase [Pseudomonadota bacterium]
MRKTGVILDIGGVLLDGERPMPGAAEALQRLRDAGIPFLLLTNTTRTCRADLLRRLDHAGLAVTSEQLLTPATMACDWLSISGRMPFLLIHPGLRPDFEECLAQGADAHPDAVVVGDAGDGFSYAALNAAFRLLLEGVPLLSLSGSRYFREGGEVFLDAGPFVRLLEEASGVRALEMGKPGELFFGHAVARLGLEAGEVSMIGDDVESDIRGACEVGLRGVLVQTGKYHPGDEDRLPSGARLARDVVEAVDGILG